MSEQTKLRVLLFSLWLLLLVPTLFLGYQTYQRLQFEALHQYRTLAETLTDGIASSLGLAMQQESARAPAEYGFALGDNRSPLSALTPTSGLPGIVGYFQVDAQGELSSPVMPVGAGLVGISVEELALRQLKLQSIENALLLDLPAPGLPTQVQPGSGNYVDADSAPAVDGSLEAAPDKELAAEAALDEVAEVRRERTSADDVLAGRAETDSGLADSSLSDSSLVGRAPSAALPPQQTKQQSANAQRNQVLYEELSQADRPSAQRRDRDKTSAARELKLDTGFFSRSSEAQTQQSGKKRARLSQTELSKVSKAKKDDPKQAPPTDANGSYDSAHGGLAAQVLGADNASSQSLPSEVKVEASLFGPTVTDFSLRPLSASHLLLFRRVWQSEQPLVQGLVLDRQQFFAGAVTNAYGDSALSEVSDLAVAVDGQVQLTLAAGTTGYATGARLSGGELLYGRYLGSPFGNVELLFSARELPLAAGASLVLWTLLVLVSLLCAGFVLLYILGRRQLQQRQQQQDFVSAVSHELKTPLTSIRMYGEMLKSGWVDEAKKPEYYDYIFNESERLSRLISNVLQLSSITRGRSDLQLGPLSVAQILDLVRSRSAAQVKAQGYQLKITCDSALEQTELEVDEDALLQVMINLIDNALKFSQGCERKELLLNAVRDGNEVVFSLRDFGPGIERGQLDKIFELFYRSESELTRETVGTGIGLALVQELVGAMGGRIAARNCEPGAEFMVRLPG